MDKNDMISVKNTIFSVNNADTWIIDKSVRKSICRSAILPLLPEMRQDAASTLFTLFMNNQGT